MKVYQIIIIGIFLCSIATPFSFASDNSFAEAPSDMQTNVVALAASSQGQPSGADFDKFSFGFGIGIGGFYPEQVNDYLSAKYSEYSLDFGSFDMYLNEYFKVLFNIRPIKYLSIEIPLEAGIAIKTVRTKTTYYGSSSSSSSSDDFYLFGRFSAGTIIHANLPIGSGRHHIRIGAGPMYHYMYFEDFSASTVGFRVVPFGMGFHFGKFNPYFNLFFDYAKASTGNTTGYYDPTSSVSYEYQPAYGPSELSYTGGGVCLNIAW